MLMDTTAVMTAADAAARLIPPVWPLAATVAVNPFLGHADEPLEMTAARIARATGQRILPSRDWLHRQLTERHITDAELAAVLASRSEKDLSPAGLRAAAAQAAPVLRALPTLADLAARTDGTDWPALVADRISHWAGTYFDQGQALWHAPAGRSLYAGWRAYATHDLSPEIHGLEGFAAHVAEAPDTAFGLILRAVSRMGLPETALPSYFHQLLMTLGGWAQVARHRLWQSELAGSSDTSLTDLLAIRLLWEEAFLLKLGPDSAAHRESLWLSHARPVEPDAAMRADICLLEAIERSDRDTLQARLGQTPSPVPRPALQAAFCIDVRSEVYRRALESLSPEIETLGFAGFFGLGIQHQPLGSDVEEDRCPVLLKPGLFTKEDGGDDTARRITARARRAFGRFRQAAVSSFAFVEATGPLYAGKLLRDSFRWRAETVPPAGTPRIARQGAERVAMARTVLRAMSLTSGFARLVLLAGHGSTSANNPFASALQCGACGGYSGEINARLLADLLNDPGVRDGLRLEGIDIPADTLFVAGLHDTTGDLLTLYDGDLPSADHAADLTRLRQWLAEAGARARGERAPRLPGSRRPSDLLRRLADWSEVRPEWGLAGCRAFIAAPRSRTVGRDFGGQVFLHSYDWRQDENFRTLELILTAPVVVASWISLQYYASSVAPSLYGSGNKLLHNIVGGIGVLEGSGGLLRTGLPWQSVHDGERLQHDPLRLTIVVEAPEDAITAILNRHPPVKALFDNGWLSLLRISDDEATEKLTGSA